MANRINHALFREVAQTPRCFAVGNLQRCANSPQNHSALRRALHGQPLMRVFADGKGWLCASDPDQIWARMRERFTMVVGESKRWFAGGCTVSRSAAFPGFCAPGKSRRGTFFSLALRLASSDEFTSRSQCDRTRCIVPRDAVLISSYWTYEIGTS